MPTEYVYIHNISDSGLDLATTGIFLDKGGSSKDSYDKEELARSAEIRKFVNLKMISLLTQDQYDKMVQKKTFEAVAEEKTSQEQEFFDTIEPPKNVQEAFTNVESALKNLKDLIEGKSEKVKKRGRKPKNQPPSNETESSQGVVSEAPDNDDIPDQPATGMEPMNDPVKKLLGRPPYSVMASEKEIKTFVMGSMDLGMLRELATFLKPGELKKLAKKKYREANAVLGG